MIEHGIPTHKFFAIAQPPSVVMPTVKILDENYKKPILDLQDPNSKQKYRAELQDTWTIDINQFEAMNSFVLLCYGLTARKLSNQLQKKYPEIEQTQKVRFLLLKKI